VALPTSPYHRNAGEPATLPLQEKDVRMLTRRTFLARTAIAAGVLAPQPWELVKSGPSQGRHAQPVMPHDAPFDTVVVLMMENRSFDHLLGWLPGADGP